MEPRCNSERVPNEFHAFQDVNGTTALDDWTDQSKRLCTGCSRADERREYSQHIETLKTVSGHMHARNLLEARSQVSAMIFNGCIMC